MQTFWYRRLLLRDSRLLAGMEAEEEEKERRKQEATAAGGEEAEAGAAGYGHGHTHHQRHSHEVRLTKLRRCDFGGDVRVCSLPSL